MTFRIIMFFLISLVFSCEKSAIDKDLELFTLKSTELINQILLEEEVLCNCLLEPPNKSLIEIIDLDRPNSENRKRLLTALELTSDSILSEQNNLSSRFRIATLNLNLDLELLKRVEFDSIFLNDGGQRGREIIWNKCPSGWLFISPPIFNETYDIAVIDISNCGAGGSLNIYKLINGKWELIRSIYNYIS